MERDRNGEPTFGKLQKEQEFVLENFDSISWIVSEDDSKRVVAKFEPTLWTNEEPSEVGKLPINSNRMTIYDNKGNLWASRLDNSEGKNVYFGVVTHMGSFYISYVPFKGAKEIGHAEKGRIRLESGNTKVNIESSDPFLPRGIAAKVYGYFDLNRKSEKVSSVQSYGSDSEEGFLKHIK